MFLYLVSLVLVAQVAARSAENARMIDGSPSPIWNIPYQVVFEVNGFAFCGGSIISSDCVITVAHCINHIVFPKTMVRAGSHTLNATGSEHTVIDAVIHEEYHPLDMYNDIGLVKVFPPFKFDSNRQPIPLNSSPHDIPHGTMALVSGFGSTAEGAFNSSPNLLYARVPIVKRSICSSVYEKIWGPIPDIFICGGYKAAGPNSCTGDSGGPVVIDQKLVGLVSYAYGCSRPHIPAVYTNVAPYVQWVKRYVPNVMLAKARY